MDFMYLVYLGILVAVIVGTYALMRWIDYGFGKKEAENKFALTRLEDERRFRMAKGCINAYTTGQQRMAMSMVKGINDSIFEMAKKMEEDL